MAEYVKYDALEVGAVFPDPPAMFRVTDAVVDLYLAATADDNPVHARTGGDIARPAPPTLAAVYIRGALMALPAPPGGVHAKQRFTFHRPARVGDTLGTTVRIVEKYVKKGHNYVIMETTTQNQHGDTVTTGRMTRIWGTET